jgi:hypothetical protein
MKHDILQCMIEIQDSGRMYRLGEENVASNIFP